MIKWFVTAIAIAGLAWQADAKPANGEAAPDFTLTDTDGNEHSLSDFKGKYVVLEWINHGCPFVKKHYESGNMQKLQSEVTADGGVWLSICSSAEGKQGYYTAEEWKDVNEEHGSKATAVLMDTAGDVGRLYAAKVTPHMFIINPAGTLVYQGAIDSIRSTDPDDIPDAIDYVSAAIEADKAGEPIEHADTPPYGCSVKY